MKICIDVDLCEKEGLDIDIVSYMLSLYFGKLITWNTFSNICSKGYIEYDGFNQKREPINAKLTQNGIDAIEDILLKSEFKSNNDEDRYDRLAEKLQEIFPSGKKRGTNYMWKDSKPIIAKKLRAIVKKYNVSFTDEQAIEAARKYVDSFNGDYQYMQILRYFISKRNNLTGEETSQLLSYIENAGQEESIDNNWQDTVR